MLWHELLHIYYWGKLKKLFWHEKGKHNHVLEFSFLTHKTTSNNPAVIRWDWPTKADVCTVPVDHIITSTVPVAQIIAGPTQPVVDVKGRGKHWFFFRKEARAVNAHRATMKCGFPAPNKRRHNKDV